MTNDVTLRLFTGDQPQQAPPKRAPLPVVANLSKNITARDEQNKSLYVCVCGQIKLYIV